MCLGMLKTHFIQDFLLFCTFLKHFRKILTKKVPIKIFKTFIAISAPPLFDWVDTYSFVYLLSRVWRQIVFHF